MNTTAQINSQIASWQRQFADAERQNEELQARISFLNAALSVAKQARSDASALADDVKRLKADSWQGKNHKKFETKKDKASSAASKYESDIDEMIKEIKARRRELQSQVDYFVKFISGCKNTLASLDRQLRQAQQSQVSGGSASGGGIR